jgi:hypothetical protein
MVTFLGVTIPVVGRVGVTNRCSFPMVGQGERARTGRDPRPWVQETLGASVVIGPHHGGPIGHKPWPTSSKICPIDRPSSLMVR